MLLNKGSTYGGRKIQNNVKLLTTNKFHYIEIQIPGSKFQSDNLHSAKKHNYLMLIVPGIWKLLSGSYQQALGSTTKFGEISSC
jgi:hypothetical protein